MNIKRLTSAALAALFLLPGLAEPVTDPDRQLQVEQALYALGYRDENCDSEPDEDTVRALRAFQTANALEVTGEQDEQTLTLLFSGVAIGSAQYISGIADEYSGQAILQRGCTGDSVTRLQQRLTELGYFDGDCDGIFGPITQRGVARFQGANGLTQSGVADSSTLLRLYEGSPISLERFLTSMQCMKDDEGQNVRTLQLRLKALGYFSGECSGSYGEMTVRAVRTFQTVSELTVSGTADLPTCELLFSSRALSRAESIPSLDPDTESGKEAIARLIELGWLDTDTANDPRSIETALILLQAAGGESMTGKATEATLAILSSDTAPDRAAAEPLLEAMRTVEDPELAGRVCDLAKGYLGQGFTQTDPAEYPGFAFVHQVCIDAGLPITAPEQLLALPRIHIDDSFSLRPGDIVLLRHDEDDWSRLVFGICTQPGFITYADADSPCVLETAIHRLAVSEVSAWTPGRRLS